MAWAKMATKKERKKERKKETRGKTRKDDRYRAMKPRIIGLHPLDIAPPEKKHRLGERLAPPPEAPFLMMEISRSRQTPNFMCGGNFWFPKNQTSRSSHHTWSSFSDLWWSFRFLDVLAISENDHHNSRNDDQVWLLRDVLFSLKSEVTRAKVFQTVPIHHQKSWPRVTVLLACLILEPNS